MKRLLLALLTVASIPLAILIAIVVAVITGWPAAGVVAHMATMAVVCAYTFPRLF